MLFLFFVFVNLFCVCLFQVKLVYVYIDGNPVTTHTGGGGKEEGEREESTEIRVFLMRRAPGHVQFDFAQDVLFEEPQLPMEPMEAPSSYPRGCILPNMWLLISQQ